MRIVGRSDTVVSLVAEASDRARVRVHVHALRLRDGCVCPECRRPTSNERLVPWADLPPDLTIRSAEIIDGVIEVETSDGHRSSVPLVDLVESEVGARPGAVDGPVSEGRPTVRRVGAGEVETDAGVVTVVDALFRDGAVLIDGVGTDEASLAAIASRLGVVQPTNYGATWEIEATIRPVTAVDSERDLAVHTDLPYRTHPPSVQLLLACVVDVAGGATTLADGFAAAERLRVDDPDAWGLLTQTELSFPFVRDDVAIGGRAPTISLDTAGRYAIVRRAPDLVGSPSVDAERAPDVYAALRRWDEILDDPDRHAVVPLEPGELLVFDNHRMLHGRTAFRLGSAGRRRLIGCYLDRDDLRSARSLAAARG